MICGYCGVEFEEKQPHYCLQGRDFLVRENDRLRAEVERLNKAIEVMNAVVVDDGKRERSLRAEVERLNGLIEQQKKSFQMGLDSAARANGTLGKLLTEAEKKASGQPDLVDSERAANAILTEEVEQLTAELHNERNQRDRAVERHNKASKMVSALKREARILSEVYDRTLASIRDLRRELEKKSEKK